jgi:hypothetical protein
MHQHGFGHHEPASSTTGPLSAIASLLAHGFADNPTDVPISNAAETVLTSVTVTPKVTGKFRVTGSAVINNPALATAKSVLLSIGRGGVADYSSSQVSVPAGQITIQTAVQAEYGSATTPTVFPIGVPVTIQLLAEGSAASTLDAPAHGAQLQVEELPN